GVALDRQREVRPSHAGAVVGNADEPPAAAVGQHVDLAGAGVERILDEFLDRTRGPLHHLAGGNAVDGGSIELADRHGQAATQGGGGRRGGGGVEGGERRPGAPGDEYAPPLAALARLSRNFLQQRIRESM